MPPGIPVATVAIDGALNAGILAAQMIATGDPAVMEKLIAYKESLKQKVVKANEEPGAVKYRHRTN
jgi:5-(carboxyamino)imidazole ribonucleotide mutase